MFWRRQWEAYLRSAESTPLVIEAWRFTQVMVILNGFLELARGNDARFTGLLLYAAFLFPTSILVFWGARRFALWFCTRPAV
jgi:hypothetical protein